MLMQIQDNMQMSVDIVLGAQLGDEGKGRLIDILASQYNIVARCNSGGNAGHKVVVNNAVFAFHLVPSGIINPNVIGIIGNGCVINLQDLYNEIITIQNTLLQNTLTQDIQSDNSILGIDITKRLFISDRAHIVLNLHKYADANRENIRSQNTLSTAIGTTKQGMGPVYATKALRVGLRICDLFLEHDILLDKIKILITELEPYLETLPHPETILADLNKYIEFFQPMVIDTITYLNNAIKFGKKILVEGAQACLLDVDFGVYPYCTATNCTAGSACIGLGIPPSSINRCYYVIKTYCTRVGNGPFPTEQLNDIGTTLQEIGHEYGTTTGRRRRCGWLDIPMIKWAVMINGNSRSSICITKLDVLDTFDEIKLATRYYIGDNIDNEIGNEIGNKKYIESFPASLELLSQVEVEYETFPGWNTSTTLIRDYQDLPSNAKKYLSRIEELLEVPIHFIGVGAERNAIINTILDHNILC
jgi:adenylosuccinate synthase